MKDKIIGLLLELVFFSITVGLFTLLHHFFGMSGLIIVGFSILLNNVYKNGYSFNCIDNKCKKRWGILNEIIRTYLR